MTSRSGGWVAALLGLAVLVIGGCASSRAGAPEGFESLFDGRTLKGWRPYVGSPPEVAKMDSSQYAGALHAAFETLEEHWFVEDGRIVTDGKGANLCTAEDFADFELLVDWRIRPGGDSGIYLRGCPQVQIWDRPDIGSGGLYNNEKHASKPLLIADRPSGEWNTLRILMVGDRVTVYLNDALVVDDTVMENYWERDKPMYAAGPIELQAHGNTVMFRNIYVRRIGSEP
ncbi:MAG: DUF1080 domain-containing protein [Phycisphaerales bacterium]|nr:DUF1080 domain-containing protein [Phycisphaerales bacterium]